MANQNGANRGFLVFDLGANGNDAPFSQVSGASTGLAGVRQVAVSATEVFVLHNSGGIGAISVFPIAANGDVAPTRVISGATAGIDQFAKGLTLISNELVVNNSSGSMRRARRSMLWTTTVST